MVREPHAHSHGALRLDAMVETSTNLGSRPERRLILVGLLRASLTTAVLVALYYVLPMNETLRLSAVVRLVVGLIIFAGVTTWQIRRILQSRYPGVRAVEALAVAAPLFILLFASTYFLMSGGGSSNFSQSMNRTDALYFTVTTFATVGFGDITATSQIARLMVTVQMVLDLLILGFGLQMGRQRQATVDDQSGPNNQ
jgi:voltage-gated potassium channel